MGCWRWDNPVSRRTHLSARSAEEEYNEDPRARMTLFLELDMHKFLELEAKRLSVKHGHRVRPPDIAKALLAAYYEKRVAGLLVDPDD